MAGANGDALGLLRSGHRRNQEYGPKPAQMTFPHVASLFFL